MSKTGLAIIFLLLTISVIPFAFVARTRATRSATPALNLIADMDIQAKNKTQSPSPFFADGRSMRPHIDGTLAQEDSFIPVEILNDPVDPRVINGDNTPIQLSSPTIYDAITLGRNRPPAMTDEQFNAAKPIELVNKNANDEDIANDTFYVKTIPPQIHVTADFIHRGQERFNIYCSPCHGESGYGDGPVNQHAAAIQEAGIPGREVAWTKPQDLNDPKIVARPDGNIFNTITNGVRTMPAYDKQISILDRWAIIAYVRAIEKSQNATDAPLPTTPPVKP